MSLRSAAAARGPAALADVARAGRAHLRPTRHAERRVDGGAGELLEELGGGLRLAGGHLGRDLAGLGAVGVLGLDVFYDLGLVTGLAALLDQRFQKLGRRAGLLHERLV